MAATDHPKSIAGQLERRREAVAAAWSLSDTVVLVGAGELIPLPGRGDMTYPFRAHSEYFYLTDRNRPGGVLAFDPASGWSDFVAPVTREEIVWSGAGPGDQDGLPLPELATWLAARAGRAIRVLGSPSQATATTDDRLTTELRDELDHVRRPKDEIELGRMRTAERATRTGFAALAPLLTAGATEREIQIELEATFLRSGADRIAFDTIVGGGPNSAVLHFAPGNRALKNGDLVLVDAGGEYRGYVSDVTRTYPVGGAFSPEQQALHTLVRAAGLAGIERCGPGVEFWDVHRASALVIAEGLVDLGLLRGEPQSLLERGAVGLFFPHGIGHMVGLGVRDAGGRLPGRPEGEGDRRRLRADLPLRPGFVITIEPGIYFIPALLQDPQAREEHRDTVVWERVDGLLGFGGIRIEDNVLVTETGHEVLTRDLPLPH